MCGIVGALSKQNVVSILIEGLKRLEYRGFINPTSLKKTTLINTFNETEVKEI